MRREMRALESLSERSHWLGTFAPRLTHIPQRRGGLKLASRVGASGSGGDQAQGSCPLPPHTQGVVMPPDEAII
jgi:hypothetical protein